MKSPASSIPPDVKAIRILPPSGIAGTVHLPGSKSLTNRALVMASLASGPSVLRNVLDCDDSRYMIEALTQLGVSVTPLSEPDSFRVDGAGGRYPARRANLYLGNAGTTVRFLTAVLAVCEGHYVIDGDSQMRRRPLGHLVQALTYLGADVTTPTGCPPVEIRPGSFRGGQVDIPGHVSSQFISGLLMAAPVAQTGLRVRVTGQLISRPYIELTIEGMREFGVKARLDDQRADGQPVFKVPAGMMYQGQDYTVEGDASAASYFYAVAAVTGATIRAEGVGKESPQGDARCADVLAAMGCRVKKERDAVTVTGPVLPRGILEGVHWDCRDIPDVVPTLAVVALFARGRSRFYGVEHLRHKESNRITSVASELRKLGGKVRELTDGVEVEGTFGQDPSPLHGAGIHSWGDHRIAMALSVAGLVVPNVAINDPQVVSKSFPSFFDVLNSLGVQTEVRTSYV